MKVVILAGGYGTRISEETSLKPKPMVEIGEKPILWHIMKIYSHYGFNDFIILLGYKGYCIKEYFANYLFHQSNLTIDLRSNTTEIHDCKAEPWKITLIDTGVKTLTGGRIKKAQKHIGNESFMLTYGDGVSDVNIPELIKTHRTNGKCATVTAVSPQGRFGALNLDEKNNVISFAEKPHDNCSSINGGFFVLQPEIFDRIEGDNTSWEREPLESLARDNQLFAYKHNGFWQPMDTLRDKNALEALWNTGKAPWKLWED